MPQHLTYVDLFAGCGGFSLGLERCGFSPVLAVEKSPMAAETYYHNFIARIADPDEWKSLIGPKSSVEKQARLGIVVNELAAVLANDRLMRELARKQLDLVVGGPPCQGFSTAGKRNPNDVRNQLPWQFLKFVEITQPKAVVIENVAGMQHDFKRQRTQAPFNLLALALANRKPGYLVQPVLLNALHYGVPQHRPRLMLIALRSDIAASAGISVQQEIWKSNYAGSDSLRFAPAPDLAPLPTCGGQPVTVKDAIADLGPDGYHHEVAPSAYAQSMRKTKVRAGRGAKLKPSNHAHRVHTDTVRDRFRLYQYFRDHDIPYKTLGFLRHKSGSAKNALRDLLSTKSQRTLMPARAPDGTVLARSSEDLIALVLRLQTKKHSQRALAWDRPSYTVMSVPDDMVHPTEPRTMTVRELARFQSFPDAFEFRAKVTTGGVSRKVDVPQYTQVANAVPPLVAEAVATVLRDCLLKAERRAMQTKRAG